MSLTSSATKRLRQLCRHVLVRSSRRSEEGFRHTRSVQAQLEELEPRLLLSTTYVVDNPADEVLPDGAITLREAIEAANTNVQVHDAPAGDPSETDIIQFAASLAGESITLDGVELEVTEDLRIAGPGRDVLAIDANGASRVFSIIGIDTDVSIAGLTITGGYAYAGGGISVDESTLELTGSAVVGNLAFSGGGISSYCGTVELTKSTVDGNTAHGGGGGIHNYCGTIELIDSTVVGNSAESEGGGIYSDDGAVRLANSTVVGNSAGTGGGGIYGFYGMVELINSTIADNSADQNGGGIDSFGTSVELTNCTVAGNSADDTGGGIGDHFFGQLTLNNTAVALNTAEWGGVDVEGSFTGASNFIGQTHGDPMLTLVTDGSGNVMHYVPQPGSPLIDAGDNALAIDGDGAPLTTDQRGAGRFNGGTNPVDGVVDIGSCEVVLPGDANRDGVVNDLDLTALALHWQQETDLWEHGDFDGNGIVDDLDLTALAANWQQTLTAPSAGMNEVSVSSADDSILAEEQTSRSDAAEAVGVLAEAKPRPRVSRRRRRARTRRRAFTPLSKRRPRGITRRAMLTDPICNNITDADACIADLLEAEREALPKYWYRQRR